MAAGLNLQPERNVSGLLILNLSNQGLTSIPEEVFDITDLEVLNVANNKLTCIPEAIGRLQKLYALGADHNMLTSLPQAIGSLQQLTYLYIYNNKLSTLPPGVEKLQKLRELYIHDNQLTEVPPGVCSLPNLEVLDVSNNKLSTLPPGVEKLQKLRELYIYDNQLTEVPPGVCSLPNLEVLDVSKNKLSTFPPGVEKLQKLTHLYIDYNQLAEVPPGVCSLSNLEVLSVSNNKLSALPPGVEKLQKLTQLNINDNQLTEVPPGVCSLPNLEEVNLGSNPIRHLPDDVTRLARLKTLDVHSCQFDEFPRQVLQLKTLEKLYAGDCKFDIVPDEVVNLQHLWFLSLEYNLLRTLPSTMSRLHNLREVYLDKNKFDTFPEVLCELLAMAKLDISRNNITRLPTALHRADKLKDLDVSGNPLTYPPQDVCEQGTGAIMAFLKQEAEKEGAGQGEEKGSATGKVTNEVRDVQVPPGKSQMADTGTETELERKLRERKKKSARMQQQTSQQRDQTAERMGSSKGAAPVQPLPAVYTSVAGVTRKQPEPLTLKQKGDNTAKDKELRQAFNRLSLKVGQNQWKPIARELGFSSQDIKNIEADCPDEPMYEALVRWRQRAGPAASLSVLEQCLRDLDLNQLAEQITRTAMSPTRREHSSEERGAVGGDLVQSRYPSVTLDRRFPIIEFERLNFPEDSILGRGGFAAVEKAYHRDWRRHVAVKRLLTRQLTGSEQELLYSEARKLNLGSRSDHVISLLGVCLDPNFAIVMPYMENGSLAQLLRDVDVPWALRWRMAHEISLGMTFLHCQNPQILHCDLKAENVLLNEDFHVKISDFGLSKWRTESGIVTSTSLTGGTITHIPPECFLVDINTTFIPTAKFDIYSFGVLLWEIVTRKQPYAHAANSTLISINVERGQRPDLTLIPTDREDVTSVSELMQTCWSQNPEDRPPFNGEEDSFVSY
ncbi:LRRIQ4 [Branchiostoma lanceolatum]|uniref:Leucine-rich repeat protein SHOC-2 n=1 Tax=Branchiostoma lanceolatum TaxID=7740 RepID=A0A8J9ZDH7_BRALA|nr:LRRIQ4 [Branchiostoma lanceolatum]